MIKILLVDDHAMVLAGFRLILGQANDIEIVGEADNGEAAVQLSRQLKPDVVLMDVQMPGISGLECTHRILRGQPLSRILAVTASGDELFARRLLEAGAAGYVTKACPKEELVQAVRQVADGQRYLSVDIARLLALRALEGADSPFEKLTPRELEIAILIASGETMPRIAKRLCITAKTVATHKYRVFEKLGVDNDVALTRLAVRHALVDPRQ